MPVIAGEPNGFDRQSGQPCRRDESALAHPGRQGIAAVQHRGRGIGKCAAWGVVDRRRCAASELDRPVPDPAGSAAAAAHLLPRRRRYDRQSLVETDADRFSGRHGTGRYQGSAQPGRTRLALGILERGNRVGIFPEGWGAKPDPEVMPSSAAWPSSASILAAACSRLLSPARPTSGVARHYGCGSQRRSTRCHREPIAMRSRPMSIACVWCCKRQCLRSRKNHRTEGNPGDG